MRIALVQMKNEGNIRENLNKSIHYIQEASENNANLILFPEVQLSEFFPQYEERDVSQYRLDILSEEVKHFRKKVKKTKLLLFPIFILRKMENPMMLVYL